MPGVLFIISTPIGNLEDISSRAKRILQEVDWLLVEDTRVTIKLLNHFAINKRMVSCHKFNEESRRALLRQAHDANEKIALVSDAGTPLISDPGDRIVAEAIALGMEVVPIPGPTACIQALVASGLPSDRFVFEGFLPDKKQDLSRRLQDLKTEPRTLVFYISPHSLLKTLEAMKEIFGNRKVSLGRELTKRFEEHIRTTLQELPDLLSEERLKGEFTLVVAGAESQSDTKVDMAVVKQYIERRLQEGASVRDVSNEVTLEFAVRKSQAYSLVLSINKMR